MSKSYGANAVLHDVNLYVQRGEIFGLLGQNGAGKTTILEIVEGLRDASAGRVTVFGNVLPSNLRQVRARLGVSLQTADFWGQMRVREVIDLFRSFYEKPLAAAMLMEMTGVAEIQRSLLKHLSGGQKQRVNLCLALVNDPDLILLDEPTVGLDPEARRTLWSVVQRLRTERRSIILTTHYLEEAQALCDRVAILHKGRIVRCEAPAALMAANTSQAIVTAQLIAREDVDTGAYSATQDCAKPLDVEITDGALTAHSTDVRQTIQSLYRWADSSGLVLNNLRVSGPSLEDVFLALVGEQKDREAV